MPDKKRKTLLKNVMNNRLLTSNDILNEFKNNDFPLRKNQFQPQSQLSTFTYLKKSDYKD